MKTSNRKPDKLNPFFADFRVPHPEVVALNNQLKENQEVFIEFAELIDKRVLIFEELITNGEVVEEYYGKYEKLMADRKSDEQVELMRRSLVHHKRLDFQFQKLKVMLATKTIDYIQNFVEEDLGSAREATERYSKVRNDCILAENKLNLFQGSKKYDEYKKEFDDLQSQFTMIQDLTIKVLADKMGASEKLMDEMMIAYWSHHYDFFVSGSIATNEMKQSVEHLVRTGGTLFDVTTCTPSAVVMATTTTAAVPTPVAVPTPPEPEKKGSKTWTSTKSPGTSPIIPTSAEGFRQASLPHLSRRSPPSHGAGFTAMFANARVNPANEKQSPLQSLQPRISPEDVQQQMLSLNKGRPLPIPGSPSPPAVTPTVTPSVTPRQQDVEVTAESSALGSTSPSIAPRGSPRDQSPSKPLMKRRSKPDALDGSKPKVFGTAVDVLWAKDNSVHIELLHLFKYLEEYGHTEDQLFDKKGNPDILSFMRNTIDSGKTLIGTILPTEVRTVSDLLIVWLEMLPDTIYTSADGMYKSIIDALNTNKVTKKIDGMISIVRKLPLPNRVWLRLISHLIDTIVKKRTKSPKQIPQETGELSDKLGVACLRAEKGHEWHASQMLKSMTLYASSFFPDGCPEDEAIAKAQARMSALQQPKTSVAHSFSNSTPILPSVQTAPTQTSSLSSSTSSLPTLTTTPSASGPLSTSTDALTMLADTPTASFSRRGSSLEDIFEVKNLTNEINSKLKSIQAESKNLRSLDLGVPIIKQLKCVVPEMEKLRTLLNYQSVVDRSSFAAPNEDKLARLRNTISIITSDCVLLINEVNSTAHTLDVQKLSEVLNVLQMIKFST